MKKGFFVIFIAILLFMGCKKDPSLICNPLPDSSLSGWNYILDSNYYQTPCFNPDNGNEFIFYSYLPHGALYKYNIQTQQLSLIIKANLLFASQWGKRDWILLNPSDANIWKIKSNGDSLTQLTFSGRNYGAYWNYAYDTIGFYNTSTGISTTYLINTNGVYLDTFPSGYGLTSASCWNNPKYIATAGCVDVNIYLPGTTNMTSVYQFPNTNNGCGYGVIFTDLNTLVWSCYYGIYQTDIITKNTMQLVPACDAKTYLSPSYSSISNKILWNKVVETPIGSNSLNVKSTIVMMNADGSGEQEINIP